MTSRLLVTYLVFASLLPIRAVADSASFDLAGPRLEVRVSHERKTLPISEVPNLEQGDTLWIRADFPDSQSVRFLLVAAFLRGSTNPPPKGWFHSMKTWKREASEGLTIKVPPGARQVLIFLAPMTSGAFGTLVGAVRGRPGAFVRASQDLNQSNLNLSRLDKYLEVSRHISRSNAASRRHTSQLLARSLALKPDPNCLQKIPELQAPCLMQGQSSVVLSDGHSTSLLDTLSFGPTDDLAMQMSATPMAGFGYFSPYVASILDIARLLSSIHTAQYQYIPALAVERGDQISLRLNASPSFHNPKSVLVTALPSVESPHWPPLRAVDPAGVYCAGKAELVLPAEGTPLIFSTAYANDMVLRLKGHNGKTIDVPVHPDAEKGGFVADTSNLDSTDFGDTLDGFLQGYWGFDLYKGPEFRLQNVRPQDWQLINVGNQPLVAGRDEMVDLVAQGAACVDSILVKPPTGEIEKAEWKTIEPNEVAVKLPLKEAKPGILTILVKQFGSKYAEQVPVEVFAPPSHLESFDLHAGDRFGELKGTHLSEVQQLTIGDVHFSPGRLTSTDGTESLTMVTSDPNAAAEFRAGDLDISEVILKDGRARRLATVVKSPRPSVTLISKSIQPFVSGASNGIQLTDQNELPQDALLTFSIRAKMPTGFSADAQVEVATQDRLFSTLLTPASGLTFADPRVAVATLDSSKDFGPSAYGPLLFRVIESGVAGDWQPLVTLVRLPILDSITCPTRVKEACTLRGSSLFLLKSLSRRPRFDHATQVPEGFTGSSIQVPHPVDRRLYLKLRDDPSVVNLAKVSIMESLHATRPVNRKRQERAPDLRKSERVRVVSPR